MNEVILTQIAAMIYAQKSESPAYTYAMAVKDAAGLFDASCEFAKQRARDDRENVLADRARDVTPRG